MSAKRPQTVFAKAKAAFLLGLMSRDEFQQVYRGEAWVRGHTLVFVGGGMWYGRRNIGRRQLRKGGAA